MQSAIAAWRAQGMLVATDNPPLVLADGCLAAANRCPAGDGEGRARLLGIGLAAIDTVLGPPRPPCGDSYQAELHRVRGELLLARDGLAAAGEAEACFGRALALGRDQGALAWELRAAMSLVRLLSTRPVRSGEDLTGLHGREEVRELLAGIYGRFTEGFDTADLVEARALLEQLE